MVTGIGDNALTRREARQTIETEALIGPTVTRRPARSSTAPRHSCARRCGSQRTWKSDALPRQGAIVKSLYPDLQGTVEEIEADHAARCAKLLYG
jgi:hypothetical protein